MEFLRAQQEKRFAHFVEDPHPVENFAEVWTSAAQVATVGIFLLLLLACLYFARGFLLPIGAAVIIATTLAPLVKKASHRGIPISLSAVILVGTVAGAAAIAITLLANPITEWMTHAPEMSATIRQKLHVFDAPLAALHELQNSLSPAKANQVKVESGLVELVTPIVAVLTPAASQTVLFVVALLFFLIGQVQFRNFVISLLANRDAKLRYLKIISDIERNLASYLGVVTLVNMALGVVVAIGSWILGLPNPVFLGLLAAILNYIPYIGPSIMVTVLLATGLVVFPSISDAVIAPMGFVMIAFFEGLIFTPMIVGRHLTLNPLAVFLAVAFWAWLWGPFGAFLAVPLSIVGLVTLNHVFPEESLKLPD